MGIAVGLAFFKVCKCLISERVMRDTGFEPVI